LAIRVGVAFRSDRPRTLGSDAAPRRLLAGEARPAVEAETTVGQTSGNRVRADVARAAADGARAARHTERAAVLERDAGKAGRTRIRVAADLAAAASRPRDAALSTRLDDAEHGAARRVRGAGEAERGGRGVAGCRGILGRRAAAKCTEHEQRRAAQRCGHD